MLEQLEEDLQTLIRIRDNLKKSINQKIKSETLQLKLRCSTELFLNIKKNLIHKVDISKVEFQLFKAADDVTNEITKLIDNKLREHKAETMPGTGNELAAPFDIKTATALVQPYDGSPEKIEAFLDSVSLLAELTNEAQTATAVKFVITRLSGKARSVLPANITTLNEIVNAVKQNCKSLETPESVAAKLKALKTKGDSEKYLESVEMLTTKLTSLYIQNEIPVQIATKMATKTGVDTLINNSTNSDTRIILKAAEFTSIQAAIQKFNESNFNTSSAQILSTQSSANDSYSRQRNSNRGNFNYRGGNRNSNSRFHRPQNSYQFRQFSPRNFNNSRGNYQNHYRYHNQNRGQHHRQNNQGHNRMFYTLAPQNQQSQIPPSLMQQQSGNPPIMQHAGNIPQLMPHPLGGTQGQFTQ